MNNIVEHSPLNIKLTDDQQKIYDKMMEFLKSVQEQEILLTSAAGTGKTTLVTKFINGVIKDKICNKVVVAAPTHKAVNIAKSKLFSTNEKITISSNIDIMTVHRLLGYQNFINNSGEVYYAKGTFDSNWTIYDLVVVDECSMLSNQIIDDIGNELKKEINKKIKVIYVGDPAQLPPVNQNESKIFKKKNIKKLSLEKIIRTKSNKIMELSNAHRKWIETCKTKDMPTIAKYVSENIILYSNNSTEKWLEKFINYLKTDCIKKTENEDNNIFDDTLNNNIILTWTNKKCNTYNDYVRRKMFNKKELDRYEKGEILIFNDFHRILKEAVDGTNNPIEEIISFYTSEQVKLIDMTQNEFQFQKIKNLRNNELPQNISDYFVKTISEINKTLSNTKLAVYYMNIQKISDLNKEETPIYQILCIHQNSEGEYSALKEYFEEYMVKLKNNTYKMVYELKNEKNIEKSILNMSKVEYLSIIEKKINRIWKDWQVNVIDRFAQLNYGYAITVHKSQGSTFKNVFLDIQDIFKNPNEPEKIKCLYTSLTRSSHSLELLV